MRLPQYGMRCATQRDRRDEDLLKTANRGATQRAFPACYVWLIALCRLLGLLLFVAAPRIVLAQAPFYTDDIGVTDPGTFHIESFDEIDALQSAQYPDVRQNTANLKLNVGLPYGLEFDLDFPYIYIDRTASTRDSHGVGDTNMGLKWQAYQSTPQSWIPSFAASFYVEFPTGDSNQELGSGLFDYALNLIAQKAISDKTRFNVNLGILFAGNTSTGVVGIETTRGQVYTGGLSALHDFSDKLTIGVEVYGGISDTKGLDRDQLQSMLGFQYALFEHTQVYAGLIVGTYTGSPRVGGQVGIAVDFPNFFFSPGDKKSARQGAPALTADRLQSASWQGYIP